MRCEREERMFRALDLWVGRLDLRAVHQRQLFVGVRIEVLLPPHEPARTMHLHLRCDKRRWAATLYGVLTPFCPQCRTKGRTTRRCAAEGEARL